MSAPEPYQPEPGAIICLVADLPAEGWEVRTLAADNEWERLGTTWDGLAIVEARPIPKPPLMVEIDRGVIVKYLTRGLLKPAEWQVVTEAFRAALAAESES